MNGRPCGAIGIRILTLVPGSVMAAGLWLVSASALWSKGTGTPFTPFAWWEATQWWLANWWVSLWLVLAAAAPTIFLAMLLFGLFQVWRLRYRGRRRLTVRRGRAALTGRTRHHRQSRPQPVAIDRRCQKAVPRTSPCPWRHRRWRGVSRRSRPERCRHPLQSGRHEQLGHGRQGAASYRSLHPRQRAQPDLRRPRRLQDHGRRLNRSHLERQQRDPRSLDRARPDAGCRIAAPTQTRRTYRHPQRG